MMDADEDIQRGHLQKALAKKSKFGVNHKQVPRASFPDIDKGENPIDGISLCKTLQIVQDRHLPFNDLVFFNHRDLWLNTMYSNMFGQNSRR